MGLKFNPPPGWPVPYGFEPPPGWEPDPTWPLPPADWPLWMGRVASCPAPESLENPGYQPASLTEPRYDSEQVPGSPPGNVSPGYVAPGYGQGYGQGYGYGQPPAAGRGGTNGFAIASLVLSLVGGALLSVIFGIVALVQLRRQPQRGKGLAIAGLVISSLWFAVIAIGITIAVLGSATRSGSAAHALRNAGKSQVDVLSLRTGDCLQSPSLGRLTQGVSKVTGAACTKPHNAQIFVQFPAVGGSYPGRTALVREASKGCEARLRARVITSRITRAMRVEFFFPRQLSWLAGRRAITCFIVDAQRDLRVSLVKRGRAH